MRTNQRIIAVVLGLAPMWVPVLVQAQEPAPEPIPLPPAEATPLPAPEAAPVPAQGPTPPQVATPEATPTPAPASEKAPPPPTPWWGEASLGVLNTSGNSDTRTVNGKLALDYTQNAWRNAFVAQTLQAADQSKTTSERYLATDKVDYTFFDQNYAFLAAEFDKDLFGGIRQRTSQTTGFGRHFLTGPRQLLDIELGAGARQQQEQESRVKAYDAIARFGADYQFKLTDTSGLRETIKVESGNANTFTQSVSELKLTVIGNLFASVVFTAQYNSQVGAGVEHTDTTTAINFSYAFGHKPG